MRGSAIAASYAFSALNKYLLANLAGRGITTIPPRYFREVSSVASAAEGLYSHCCMPSNNGCRRDTAKCQERYLTNFFIGLDFRVFKTNLALLTLSGQGQII